MSYRDQLLPVAAGGTGIAASGSSGNVLTSNGTAWVSSAPAGTGDVTGPAGATSTAIATYNGATGKIIQNSIPTIDSSGNILTSASLSGATLSVDVVNSSNTASSAARMSTTVAGGTAADALFQASISGGQVWTWGLDNSASDAFVLSASSSLGTSNVLVATTTGNVTQTQVGTSTALTFNCRNTDTNAASTSDVQAAVANGSAADAYFQVAVEATSNYAIGIDNSDSDKLKICFDPASTTPSGATNLWTMTSTGEQTLPLQPAFLAYVNTTINNVSGDSTVYTIIYDTEVFDQGADFNLGTSTFTAPVTGRYYLNQCVLIVGATVITSANARIVTSNRTYNLTIGAGASLATTNASINQNVLADMDAADTMTITVATADSGGKVDDVSGTTSGDLRTWVSGYLAV